MDIPVRKADPRAEDGFTLIELMVATLMALILVGGAVSVFTTGIRSQPEVSDKAAQIAEGRVLMERVSRELRQSYGFGTKSATTLQVYTYVNETPCGGAFSATKRQCLVTYSCASGACTRTVRNTNGTGTEPARTLVSGLSSNSIFSYTPNSGTPAYIGLKLVFPATPTEDAITLEDGVALRNPVP